MLFTVEHSILPCISKHSLLMFTAKHSVYPSPVSCCLPLSILSHCLSPSTRILLITANHIPAPCIFKRSLLLLISKHILLRCNFKHILPLCTFKHKLFFFLYLKASTSSTCHRACLSLTSLQAHLFVMARSQISNEGAVLWNDQDRLNALNNNKKRERRERKPVACHLPVHFYNLYFLTCMYI